MNIDNIMDKCMREVDIRDSLLNVARAELPSRRKPNLVAIAVSLVTSLCLIIIMIPFIVGQNNSCDNAPNASLPDSDIYPNIEETSVSIGEVNDAFSAIVLRDTPHLVDAKKVVDMSIGSEVYSIRYDFGEGENIRVDVTRGELADKTGGAETTIRVLGYDIRYLETKDAARTIDTYLDVNGEKLAISIVTKSEDSIESIICERIHELVREIKGVMIS